MLVSPNLPTSFTITFNITREWIAAKKMENEALNSV